MAPRAVTARTDVERVGSIWQSFVLVASLGAVLIVYLQMNVFGAQVWASTHASRPAGSFASDAQGSVPSVGAIASAPARLAGATPAAQHAAPSAAATAATAGLRSNATLNPPMHTPPPGGYAVSERFRSVGKLAVYHGGDLEAPGELERAVATRSYNGELVLTYANEAGTAWAANLLFSLRDIGIDHSMVIVMSKAHCDALATSRYGISCGWSSWDMEGCKADDGPVAKWAFIERLWFIRHHYLARLIRLRVNVMALDGDMIVHGDPYAILHSAALAKHHVVITSDGSFAASEVNNGFLYLHNCTPGGQVERVLREVVYREMDVCLGGEAVFGMNGTFWRPMDEAGITGPPHHIAFTGARDQKYYQDVLTSAFCGRKVIHRMPYASHKVLDGRRFDALLAGADMNECARFRDLPSRRALGSTRDGVPALDQPPPPWHELNLPLSRAGRGSILPDRDGASLPGAPAPAAETIALLTAPALSTWHGTATGEIAGWSGHWINTPPMITHFVGCLSKAEAMQSLAWWHYESDDVSAEVAQRVRGTRPMGAILPSLLPLVRGPAPRLLAISGPPLHTPIHSKRAFIEWNGLLRTRLAVLGAQLGRAAVEPLVDCRAQWIPRFPGSFHNIRQTPGWPWPFDNGVGALMGPCRAAQPEGHPPGLCCHPIFGPKVRENWFNNRVPMVHHQVLEATATELGERTARALASGAEDEQIARVPVRAVLADATPAGGARAPTGPQIDLARLTAAIEAVAPGRRPPIVVLTLDGAPGEGGAGGLPAIAGVEPGTVRKVVGEAARVYWADFPKKVPPPDEPPPPWAALAGASR